MLFLLTTLLSIQGYVSQPRAQLSVNTDLILLRHYFCEE